MLFQRTMRLILDHAVQAVDRRGAEETREDVLYCLKELEAKRCPGDLPAAAPSAIWLVESSAWTILWTLIEIRRRMQTPGNEVHPSVLTRLEASIEKHFEPLLQGD